MPLRTAWLLGCRGGEMILVLKLSLPQVWLARPKLS